VEPCGVLEKRDRLLNKEVEPLAGGEGFWLVEADWSHPPGKAVRFAPCRRAIRLQLRRTPLMKTAKADGPERGLRPRQSCV
jgi:hypothetical protein